MQVLTVDIEEAGYEAGKPQIHHIAFELQAGQLLGLIGPNGAGKSTTLKSIMGLLPFRKGTVQFEGELQHYAYIPEKPILYEAMTLWEHLEIAAAAYHLDQAQWVARANELLAKFRMEAVRHHLPGSFSKGMQQKMMLIIGFMIQPAVYIVDEPFVGLDPRATKDFLKLLDDERSRGAGVLMSTHVLDTAERICDSFVLINQGRIVAKGILTDIQHAAELEEATLLDCFDALT